MTSPFPLLALTACLLSACTLATPTPAPPTASPTSLPTATTPPTSTLTPTFTPSPSATSTPIPPTPTETPSPTADPWACAKAGPGQDAAVLAVIEGDSIEVSLDGAAVRVRYIGMDTPETDPWVEFFGPAARDRNAGLVAGQRVTLYRDVSEADPYGRLLRYVFVGDTFVNYALTAEGFAEAMETPPDTACTALFQAAEQEARLALIGMWGPTPTYLPASGDSAQGAACNCAGPDLDCADFASHAQAQACYEACLSQGYGDVFRLDRDANGSACESLP